MYVSRARAYCEEVASGKRPASKWTRYAVARHLKDLERQNDPSFPFKFDEAKAERACKFVSLLPHVKGKWAAKAERIDPAGWQCFVVGSIFGWVRKDDGRRRFSEAYIFLPRKNGKSTLAAAIGLYMLTADREFGAEVYSGATTERQAWEVFRPAKTMALKTPELCYRFGVEVRAKSLYRPEDGGRMEPVIGKPGDGSSPSCAILDEYHEHETNDQYETMVTGMGAREQPLMLIITTAGTNLSGPCHARHEYAQQVLKGELTDEAFFAIIYTIDEDVDEWDTIEAAQKANPNFGISIFPDRVERALTTARQSPYLQTAYKTKHLNIWCGARTPWIDELEFAMAPDPGERERMRGRRCFAGLDLGTTDDLSALIELYPPEDDDLWRAFARFWTTEHAVRNSPFGEQYKAWAKQGHIIIAPGNMADFDGIQTAVVELKDFAKIEAVGFDPWQAMHLAANINERAPMVKVPQNTQHLSEPMKLIRRLVTGKKFAVAHPVLKRHMLNTACKEDVRGNLYPHKENDNVKIDGALALLNAGNRAFTQVKVEDGLSAWAKR